jgi:hypothetical protein
LQGEYQETYHISGPDAELGTKLLLDNESHMFVLGSFRQSVDFDLGKASDIYSSLGSDAIFIAKYSICATKDTLLETAGCDSLAVNNETYFRSGQYIQHLTTKTGCDSILHLLLTIDHTQYSQLTVDICPG